MKRTVVLSALLATGCVASDPDSIQPMSISTMGYAQADCAALAAEDRRVADILLQRSLEQENQRTGDLIGVSPTGMGSPEYSAEISRLKGERQTIATVKAQKGCMEPPATADATRIRQELKTQWSAPAEARKKNMENTR